VDLGRFEPHGFIGQGSFGAVWRVRDPLRPGADLALKVLTGRSSPAGARRARRELEVVSAVRHPSVLEVLEAGFLDSSPYFLSELVPGRPLEAPIAADALAPMGAELLSALDAIHSAGWRHGDLKPANVLWWQPAGQERPELRILDFGLAAQLDDAEAPATAGTPHYLAPEVLRGARPDERSDLYALGLMLFEAWRGPWKGPEAEHLLRTRQGRLVEDAREAELPEPLAQVVRRLLEPEPKDRPSAREAIEVLQPAAELQCERAGERRSGDAARSVRSARLLPSFESAAFIGSEVARTSVDDALRAAAGPQPLPSLLLVEGEGGSGKTRLVREATLTAFRCGMRALAWPEVRALLASRLPRALAAAHEPHPYHPVVELGGLERSGPDSAGDVDAAAGIVLNEVLSRPTVLLVDDYDRLPPTERIVLRAVLARVGSLRERPRRGPKGRPRLAVVFTASPARAARAGSNAHWRALAELPWAQRLALGSWTDGEAREYLDRVLRPRRDLGRSEGDLLRAARGNPARLRLLLVELARRASLRFEGGAWRCDAEHFDAESALPDEAERFAESWTQLDEEAQDALGLCAVLGAASESVTPALLAEVSGRPPGELRRLLCELEALELLTVREGTLRESLVGAWTLPRAAALRALRLGGPERRESWRQAFARLPSSSPAVLEQKLRAGAARAEELAAAYERDPRGALLVLSLHARLPSYPPAERALSARRAGESLVRQGELRRGAELLMQALEWAAPGEERAGILSLLAAAAMGCARRDEAEELLTAAAAEPDLSPESRAQVLVAAATNDFQRGHAESAERRAEEARRHAAALPAPENVLGNIALARGDIAAAEAAFSRALALARARRLPREEGAVLSNLGRLYLRSERFEDAAEVLRQAAGLAEAAGFKRLAAAGLGNLGVVLRRLGDLGGAIEAQGRVLDLCRELADDSGRALAEANLAVLAREAGLPGTAARRLRAAALAAARAGKETVRGLAANTLLAETRALLALDLGRREQAARIAGLVRGRRRAANAGAGPEALLLEARLAEEGVAADPHEALRLLGERDLVEADAAALWVLAGLASGSRDADRTSAEAACWAEAAQRARQELERLAGRSKRPLDFRRALAIAGGADADSAAARELPAQVEALPQRDLRRRLLMLLLRSEALLPHAERLRALLRRLLDEVTYDLEPRDREAFLRRPQIQESMEMTRTAAGERAGRSREVLRQVLRLNAEMLDEGQLERLFVKVVDAAVALVGAERGALVLRRGGRLETPVLRGGSKATAAGELRVSRTIIERVLADGKPCLTTDAQEDAALRSIASVEELGLRSVLCVPLLLRRRVVGVLYLDNAFAKSVFDEQDLEVAELFCAQAVLAWRSAERRGQVAGLLRELREANRQLHGELRAVRQDAERRRRSAEHSFHGLAGDSAAMRRVFQWIEAVAPTDIPVLITGESGTGKELVARAVHLESGRAQKPFVAENCAAVPAGLLESALFGHVKGAFTGADSDRPGLFELAHGGTLFLDEVAEMPAELQARLLRVLQEKEVRPLGSRRVVQVDVRVVAATNRDVAEAVASGTLREDLYYRLQGAEVHVPPLRERPEDIPLLVETFLARTEKGRGARRQVAPETMDLLVRYPWPGNVRELENEVRRMAVFAGGERLGPECLSEAVRSGGAPRAKRAEAEAPRVRPLLEAERDAILAALDAFGGHRGKAAAALGVSRSTLYLKLKAMGRE
jgi:transcriptional regulator with GAF, ATPase, and Fis domain/tetratricopeptide (TPR) repeat protein